MLTNQLQAFIFKQRNVTLWREFYAKHLQLFFRYSVTCVLQGSHYLLRSYENMSKKICL